MIRFDLNMEHDEVYGKFVLTVCICLILYFCQKIHADYKQTDSASLFTGGLNILSWIVLIFAKAQNANSKLFSWTFVTLSSLLAKSSLESSEVNKGLKTIHEAFRFVIYFKLKPKNAK